MSGDLDLLLVVPSAEDTAATQRLLALAEALAALPGLDLRILVWASGPRVAAFASVAPTVDAGEVNRWGPARQLSRLRLGPVARLVKNQRLRSLVAGLRDVDAAIVGGLDGVAACAWLPSPPGTTALLVSAADLSTTPGRTADLTASAYVVATDADALPLLEAAGVQPDRIRVHGLVPGPDPETPVVRDRVGLVGWDADEVREIIGALVAEDPATEVTWFAEEEAAWALWQGPTASPAANCVHLAPPSATAPGLARLRVLVEGRTGTGDITATAPLFAVPVVRTGARAVADAAQAALDPPEADPSAPATRTVLSTAAALAAALSTP